MKKIVILALHLSTGGIEKSISTLSNILIKKYDIEIISNYQIEEKPAFEIDKNVKITYLKDNLKPNAKEFKEALKRFNLIRVLIEGIKAIKILYLRRVLMIKAIKNLDCDIAISTRYIHSKLLGKYANKNIIKIAQEHNNNGNKNYINKVIKSLKNINYFMPVSRSLTEFYSDRLRKSNTKCLYIPHCLRYYPDKTSNLENKNIISIGRLSPEKGFIDLIDVFNIVSKKNPDWHLNIAGDGVQREKLKEKIKEYKLEDKVSLLGFKTEEEIRELLLNSSIYAMPSINECFPLVLIEAESFGLPLIAFDSAEGAKEIIEDNHNGFLVGNRDNILMANKINELINNIELRKKLGQVSREKSEQFKMINIEKIWYKFIDEI